MNTEEASQTSQWKKELENSQGSVDLVENKGSEEPLSKKRKINIAFSSIAKTPISPVEGIRVSPIPTSPKQNLDTLERCNEEVKILKAKLEEAERKREKAFSDAKRYYKFCPTCYQKNRIKITDGTSKCKDGHHAS